MSCMEALILPKIKQHFTLLRPFGQLIKIILSMLSICNICFPEQCAIVASKGNQILGLIRRNIVYKERRTNKTTVQDNS